MPKWLIRMVENLLSVTRMDDGTSEARLRKQVEVAEEVVSAAVDRLHKRFPQRDVTRFRTGRAADGSNGRHAH